MKIRLNCPEIHKHLLEAFDEGALDNLPDNVEKHIESCNNCQQNYLELVELDQGLAHIPVEEPSLDYWINFLPRLRQRMERVPAQVKRGDRAWRPALGTALVLTLLLIQSPQRISQPGWYAVDSQSSIENDLSVYAGDNITDQEFTLLEAAWEDENLIASSLMTEEHDIIELFSTSNHYYSSDNIDDLARMDDDAIEYFLEQLKNRPIISS